MIIDQCKFSISTGWLCTTLVRFSLPIEYVLHNSSWRVLSCGDSQPWDILGMFQTTPYSSYFHGYELGPQCVDEFTVHDLQVVLPVVALCGTFVFCYVGTVCRWTWLLIMMIKYSSILSFEITLPPVVFKQSQGCYNILHRKTTQSECWAVFNDARSKSPVEFLKWQSVCWWQPRPHCRRSPQAPRHRRAPLQNMDYLPGAPHPSL